MSYTLFALQNSAAQELDRVLDQGAVIGEFGLAESFGLMPLYSTPGTDRRVISATNEVNDPAGMLLSPLTWQVSGGRLTTDETSADLPPRWRRCVKAPAGTGPVVVTALTGGTPAAAGTVWTYALLSSSEAVKVALQGTAVLAERTVAGGPGWKRVRLQASNPPAEQLKLVFTPQAGGKAELRVTGATICRDGDPGEPFGGDSPDAQKDPNADNMEDAEDIANVLGNFAYTWIGPRGASHSIQCAQLLDTLALAEAQAHLQVAPLGTTVAERRAYLQLRFESRHRPWAETFVTLLKALISQISPLREWGVRVVENIANFSFWVEIRGTVSPLMQARVLRLAREIKPAHLALEGPEGPMVWGNFIVARTRTTEAEPPVVGYLATTTGPNAPGTLL
jgi:hypothetical protein